MRTTNSAVRKLLEVTDDVSVSTYIEMASELVTEFCVPLEYTESRLEMIERWLAAHFYAVFAGQIESEKVDELSRSFQGKIDKYLDYTKYGQQAIVLDTKGGLSAWQEDLLNPTDPEAEKIVVRQMFWAGGGVGTNKPLTEY